MSVKLFTGCKITILCLQRPKLHFVFDLKDNNYYENIHYEVCYVERGLNASVKSIDSPQAAPFAQSDKDWSFSLLLSFLNHESVV